jgi:hypothetical protein
VSQLFPPHIHELADLPHTIFDAIRSAAIFLSFDELADDERPPRRIWRDGEKLSAHFDEVRRRRNQDTGHDIEDPVENEAARHLITG